MNIVEYDGWATMKVLERCTKLTDTELEKPTGIGRGTIGVELAHLAGSYKLFSLLLSGAQLPPRPEKPEPPARPAVLLERYKEDGASFKNTVTSLVDGDRLNESMVVPWSGANVSRLVFLMNALDHSGFHRAEIEIMLNVLGLEAFPEVSVIRWTTGK